MIEFFAALGLFLLAHMIPARPAFRERLARRLGERLYLFLYSGLSLALIAWLISAAARAPFIPLWNFERWQYWVPILAMAPAFILFAGGAIAPNPLSINLRRKPFDPGQPGIVAVTRHPLLWGFALWAFAHVVPNGDLVSLILFGGFGLFALAGMALIDRRRKRQLGESWAEPGNRTSILPFGPTGKPRLKPDGPGLLTALLVGSGLYLAMLHAHPWLFGPDPMAIFQ